MALRIVLLTQYYPPEVGAPQNRLSDLARRLAERGHAVTVLTALPNYPRGEIYAEYNGRYFVDEHIDGIRVIRSWVYATREKSFSRRLLNYLSFALTSIFWGIWKLGAQDIIVAESPPLFVGISAVILGKLKRAKFIFNVSDLWPASAVALGFLRNPMVIGLSRWLEEFIYWRADAITGQTEGIVDDIRRRVPRKRVDLITNGVDVQGFPAGTEGSPRSDARAEYGCGKRFVVGYAGLHGLAQGLETVIEAADILRGHGDILFVFVGDGPERERLIECAAQRKLANIKFLGPQARSQMARMYQMFDVAVVPLKRCSIFKGALPSKMLEAMAAAVPVVVSIEGEARLLVLRAQAGIAVEPEDARGIANAILQLSGDEAYRQALARNGRRYVEEYYDRRKIASRFEELLVQVNAHT